jgi:hypothetical protein
MASLKKNSLYLLCLILLHRSVLEFSCQMHQQEIMSKLLYYFLVMRIKEYYKTDFKHTKKLSKKRKNQDFKHKNI